jgi:alpha-glucosidase
MLRKLLFSFLVMLTFGCLGQSNQIRHSFLSPDREISFEVISSGKNLILQVNYKDQKVEAFLENYGGSNQVKSRVVKSEWTTIAGERSNVEDYYKEIIVMTKDEEKRDIKITCRLYNEGMAFRTEFDPVKFQDNTLSKEPVHWTFGGDYKTWTTERSQGEYQETTIGQIEKKVERPLLIQGSQDVFYAIGEAGVIKYPRSKFIQSSIAANTLALEPDGQIDLRKADYMSPWRFVLVGENPGVILEHNYILKNLNKENQIKETSWIRPGKVIREVTLTTTGGKACVDFAAAHGLQYVEFDAGWYGNEYSKESDASTVTVDPKRSKGPLDLPEVIKYAKGKGIGIILYVNNKAMLNQLDEILPLYKSWGISGVKYGFVNTGIQDWNIWLHEAVVKAAENQLMVDIHDDYRPTGFSRTYPNLMTQEGIRGDEESPSVEHSLYTIFIRGIAGAGDNTNCYLAPRVVEKMGGKGAQLAKSIMIFSPWQFLYWYDRPVDSPRKKGGAGASEGVLTPDIGYEFYADLPTVWDESKVLAVEMGEYGTIARKKDGHWYIGSLNANENRLVELELDFLDEDAVYDAIVYFQDGSALQGNRLMKDEFQVTSKTIFQKELLANSGFALVLKRKR